MATMTEITTDKRVDDLRVDTRRGFEQTGARIDDLRSEIKFDAKFDSLNRTIIVLLGGSLSVVTGGLIAAAFHVIS